METIIQDILKELSARRDLLVLFREKLGFRAPVISAIPFDINKETIKGAEIIAEFGLAKIFYLNLRSSFDESLASERKIRKIEREILRKLPAGIRKQNMFIFSDSTEKYWDFVYPAEYGPRLVLKRFTIRPDNRDKLRTPATQLANLVVKPGEEDRIYKKLEDTFSVEAVSARFFEDFERMFNAVKKALLKQSSDYERVHRFVHQLLNRLMFLYFVQRRGVFSGDKNFLATFWNAYRNSFEGKNEFYDKWLKILFFEALNGKFRSARDYLKISDTLDFNSVLRVVPYLNGGLFREDPEIDYLNIKLTDNLFIKIFDFLESYNFTVRENTPLDEDLEIDPEMLGNIYEAMVNVTEIASEDERHKAGIFYTPRTEIEFMLRRSLVEFLFNKTKVDKFQLYQFIFPEIDKQKIPKFPREDARKLYDILDCITTVDPACGSGHYLVVTVQALFDLKKELWVQLGNSEESFPAFKEKLKIIEGSIFGVDIKKWATEIAKLRLWLDLMIEAKDEQLGPSGEALLPNLAFKIRVGDSLVQEIGGVFFRAKEIKDIPPSLIALRDQLIDVKKDYFHGLKDINEKDVKSKEIKFFKALLEEKINNIKEKINKIEASLREQPRDQMLFPTMKGEPKQAKLELSKKDRERISQLKEDLARLEEEKKKLSIREFAFWPIEFAEILSGGNGEGGFDIVIANPPYVRQELISDPKSPENKLVAKKYKENLLKQMRLDWNDEGGNLIKISQRADLYVYFYLKGLQLLNPDGVMCYISSNSWLDVSFGAGLQEVLLRRVPILAIYDNQVKRAFKHADINTIIAVLKAPKLRDWDVDVKNNKVKFVMFKKPFEEVTFTEVLWQIEGVKQEKISTEEFRLVQKNQWELYLEGIKEGIIISKKQKVKGFEDKEIFGGIYLGNKWGGKYLRAPDIYWKILEKGKDKLIRLGDIAEVRFGIKTGANEFFYLDKKAQKKWKIEKEFLKPVIKSPRECRSILIRPENLKYKVFMCHKPKEELKGTGALEYIKWGEKVKLKIKRGSERGKTIRGYQHLETIKNRKNWYDLGKWKISRNILAMFEDIRKYCFWNNPLAYIDAALYWVYPKNKEDEKGLCGVLNSTLFSLWKELVARPPEGLGVLQMKVYHYNEMPILNPELLKSFESKIKKIFNNFIKREIKSIFEECGINPKKPIRDQEPNPLSDRKALDDIIFDILGLTKQERKEVYWAICELVKNRLEKARSL